jgi:hypothetical protein
MIGYCQYLANVDHIFQKSRRAPSAADPQFLALFLS